MSSQPRRASPDNIENQTLQHVLTMIGNPAWDILIVGDGSGSGWSQACGWAATLIDCYQRRRFFYGGMDCGSISIAESMPYIQALTWYDVHYGKKLLKQFGQLRVHVITDSQVIATWGGRAMSPAEELPRKQLAVWAPMRELRRVGYHCEFHWAPRQTTTLNDIADILSKQARRSVMDAADPANVLGRSHADRAATALDNLVLYDPDTEQPITPYTVNPAEG